MKKNCFFLVLLLLFLIVSPSLAADYNYAEALQKALYFYECQRSGALPLGNRVEWRGDSGMQDGADAGRDLTGGWYDAGDHVKFGLPLAYSASQLGWAVYEYRSAFADAGLLANALDNVKWATDYIIKCHTGPNEFYYQVGDGHLDHSWWGPAEAMQMSRPSYRVTLNSPGSAVVAESAAALAVASLIFAPTNPGYAALCLDHAEQLFAFADRTKSDSGYTAANGFYDSWSGFWDELSWAGAWLYLATGDTNYLTKAEEYVEHWEKEPQSDIIGYKWAHCWDNKVYGAQILLARITGKDLYITSTERHLDYWSVGYNGERITYTPGGLAWLDTWGALRYSSTTAFLAYVYGDWVNDPAKKQRYHSFAEGQIRYALGDNPRNSSYVVGFGFNPPQRPHHRTSHGSWADSMNVPPYHRHVLYGALVGGPNSNDAYTDDISDYVCNEVACDYNAGFVGALAKMYNMYGGNILPNFPPPETRDDEYFVEAGVNSSGNNYTEIRAYLNNRSGWPARVADRLSFKYFMDLSEIFAAGYTLDDLTLTTNYNEGAVISGILPYDTANHIYYVILDYTGTKIYPGGQSAHRKEVQFRISLPAGTHVWNPDNDWSYQGLSSGTLVQTPYIPVYDNGVLLWGEEPEGVVPPTPTPTTSPDPTPTPTPTTEPEPTPTPTPTTEPTATPTEGPTPTPTPTSSFEPGQVRVEARCEESNPNVQSLIRMNVWNEDAVTLSNLSARYFVDLSEVYAAGYLAGNVTLDVYYSSTGVTVSPLTAYDTANRIYYYELDWGSYSVTPGARLEANFSIHLTGWQPAWDPANDWSYQGLSGSYTNTPYIPVYRSGELIYGLEPDGSPPPTPTPTTEPEPTPTPTSEPEPTPTPTTEPEPTPTPTTEPEPTPTPTPTTEPVGDYVVDYVIVNDWGSGATIDVTITNKTSAAVNGWTLAWTFPGNQQISNLWGGSYTQTGTSVSVTNLDWNADIAANGGSVNFGFNINYSGVNDKPTDFTLNGVPCSSQ